MSKYVKRTVEADDDDGCLSQYEVARRLGTSRTRVKQIEERAGWDEVLGIEKDPQWLPACRARCTLAEERPLMFEPEARRTAQRPSDRQMGLFGGGTK